MTSSPCLWSEVYHGTERHIVVHVKGTRVASMPAELFERHVRFTHQGNLQNAEGEYEWSV